MQNYKVIAYYQSAREHLIEDGKGNRFRVDLFVDASFNSVLYSDENTIQEIIEIERNLVGKKLSIKKLSMLHPVYFAEQVSITQ